MTEIYVTQVPSTKQSVPVSKPKQTEPSLSELLSPKVEVVKMEEVETCEFPGAKIRLPSGKWGIVHSWSGWVLYDSEGNQVGRYGGGDKKGIFYDNAGKPIAKLASPVGYRLQSKEPRYSPIPIYSINDHSNQEEIGRLKIDNSSSLSRVRIWSKNKLIAKTKEFTGPIDFQVADMDYDPTPGDFHGVITHPVTKYMIGTIK